MCWGCKENTDYNIKEPPHMRLNSYKGARLHDCAAVATCNSDTCILSPVNNCYHGKWTVVNKIRTIVLQHDISDLHCTVFPNISSHRFEQNSQSDMLHNA